MQQKIREDVIVYLSLQDRCKTIAANFISSNNYASNELMSNVAIKWYRYKLIL
jgi:hypothetical protein